MKSHTRKSRVPDVLVATVVLIALAALLGLRIDARGADPADPPATVLPAHRGAPAAATVPDPDASGEVPAEVPCWACPQGSTWPVTFRSDLDLIAPLGDGPENAALWFKDFAKVVGARAAEADAAMGRRTEDPGGVGDVLPPDDPLLLEAEPWCDRAAMEFYPEFFAIDGYETQIPNLLFMLTLARSWVARGDHAEDLAAAMDDYRRVVRLGRLLRQEDVTIINDLVGLACIRMGTDRIYRTAVKTGDRDLAIAASIVLGEIAPQRLMTSARISDSNIEDHVERSWFRGVRLDVPDDIVDNLIRRARDEQDRRFRLEAMLTLNYVVHLGPSSQRSTTTDLLEEMTESDDPVVAATAHWAMDTEPNLEYLEP